MTSNNEKKLLTKSDINKVFWRSFTVNASFNYERQMSQGAQYALSPILQKLYPDKKELGEALQRHAEFFNTTPMLCPFIFGITAAMEEENATQEDFDPNTINSVKAGLMGPLAGIGDSVFWGTLRPLAGGHCLLAGTDGQPICTVPVPAAVQHPQRAGALLRLPLGLQLRHEGTEPL